MNYYKSVNVIVPDGFELGESIVINDNILISVRKIGDPWPSEKYAPSSENIVSPKPGQLATFLPNSDHEKSGCEFLSKEILKLRKMIQDLKRENSAVEQRVWDLEGHTTEEQLQRTERMVAEFAKRADELEKFAINPDGIEKPKEPAT